MPLSVPTSGGEIDPITQKGIFAPGQWGYYSAAGAATMDGIGFIDAITTTDVSSGAGEDETGRFFTQNTGAAPNRAFVEMSADKIRIDQLFLYVAKWRLSNIVGARSFCGVWEVGVGTLTNDNVGANAIGVQFSSGRGDINFQFLTHDGAVQTIIDSGVPADTLPHFVQVNASAVNSVTVRILDTNFVEQGTTTFETINPVLPLITTDMGIICGLGNTLGASKSIDQYYGTVVLRNS